MQTKLLTFKTHVLFFLLLCTCIGIFFAFIFQEYWNRIQSEYIEAPFPVGPAFLYVFCSLSYLLQGLSFCIISEHSKKTDYSSAFYLFWIQFVLGLLWLGTFFGLKLFGTALFFIFTTFILLAFTFSIFKKINSIAAYLLVPYAGLLIFVDIFNIWYFIF